MLWWFSVFLNKISSLVRIPKRRGRSIDCGVHLTRGDILCLLVTAGALQRDVHVTNYGCYGCYGCYPVVFFGLYHVVSISCHLFRFETKMWQWGIIRLSWLPKYRACLLLNNRHARAWLPTPRTTFAETWVLVRGVSSKDQDTQHPCRSRIATCITLRVTRCRSRQKF